jgi:GDP-L-fucose synthase
MEKNSKIYVAGHRGLVGSAIVRRLAELEYTNVVTIGRNQLDLVNQSAVDTWFEVNRPEYVFLTAAQVCGIAADVSGEVILNNLRIQTNVIDAARRNGCKKLLFTGSNCAYPKHSKLPITEDQLLSGYLEPTSEAYSVAKIAGIKMCEYFRKQWGFNGITVMPCNLYGLNDNFELEHAHVMAAMINKFVTAKQNNISSVVLWGDGSARREFLYSDDAADALIFCMINYNEITPINLASGQEITLKDLAEKIKKHVRYTGDIVWDKTKPVGTVAKNLDITKLTQLGWQPKYDLDFGIPIAVEWFINYFKASNK